MSDEDRTRESTREGFRAWLGVLDAFREAIDETIEEVRQRGELSPDRAKEAMRDTMRRAQSAMGEAKERLDLVPRREFDALRAQVADLMRRIEAIERGPAGTTPTEGE